MPGVLLEGAGDGLHWGGEVGGDRDLNLVGEGVAGHGEAGAKQEKRTNEAAVHDWLLGEGPQVAATFATAIYKNIWR
ncbi:hypothetical protein Pstr01_45260 [Pseudomonas straminea]|nr:hypothetical protein Pstr01_45260 [Pseudomonas straminea]